jgi:U3 small nucleolar RNA-associated protein 10
VLLSDGFSLHMDRIIAKLQGPDSHGRLFGLLVTRTLISRVAGERQIEAAHKFLANADFGVLGHMENALKGSDTAHDVDLLRPIVQRLTDMSRRSLRKAIWGRPS